MGDDDGEIPVGTDPEAEAFEDIEVTIRTNTLGLAVLGAALNLATAQAELRQTVAGPKMAATMEGVGAFARHSREELDDVIGSPEEVREALGEGRTSITGGKEGLEGLLEIVDVDEDPDEGA